MSCPDLSLHYFVVMWMLDIAQVGFWIGVWELLKFLWRVARGKSSLTSYNDEE